MKTTNIQINSLLENGAYSYRESKEDYSTGRSREQFILIRGKVEPKNSPEEDFGTLLKREFQMLSVKDPFKLNEPGSHQSDSFFSDTQFEPLHEFWA